jgi:hypothetical protein
MSLAPYTGGNKALCLDCIGQGAIPGSKVSKSQMVAGFTRINPNKRFHRHCRPCRLFRVVLVVVALVAGDVVDTVLDGTNQPVFYR